MPASDDDLDQTLTRLRAALSSQATVLLDIEASPGRALLDPARLTGRSASLASDTLGRLVQAWRAYAVLKHLLGQAGELRGQRLDGRRRAELAELLHGYSVPEVLASSRSALRSLPPGQTDPGLRAALSVEVARSPVARSPVARSPVARSPLARSPRTGMPMRPEGRVTPTVLSRRLDQVLREVSTTATWFSATYARCLATLSTVRADLAELTATAQRLGERDDRALALAWRLFTETAAAAAADPAAVAARDLQLLGAAVAAASSGLSDLARRHDGLAADLADAEILLAEIVQIAEAGRRDAEHAQRRIPSIDGLLRLSDGWLDHPRHGLAPWLARLRGQAADGRWKEASRGLAGWRNVAEANRTTATQVAVTNAAARRRRDDVFGLFDAWQAKARRLGVADDPELVAAALSVRSAMYQATTEVTDARRHVDSYARRLRTLTRHRPRTRPTDLLPASATPAGPTPAGLAPADRAPAAVGAAAVGRPTSEISTVDLTGTLLGESIGTTSVQPSDDI